MPIEHLTPVIQSSGSALVARPVRKKYFLSGAGFPFFCFLIFGIIFLLASVYLTQSGEDFLDDNIKQIFVDYSRYSGFVFGFLSLIVMYILYALKKLFSLSKIYWLNPLIAALAVLPWRFFTEQPVYFDERYADVARGVKVYIGAPLNLTVLIFSGLCALWLVIAVIVSVKNSGK